MPVRDPRTAARPNRGGGPATASGSRIGLRASIVLALVIAGAIVLATSGVLGRAGHALSGLVGSSSASPARPALPGAPTLNAPTAAETRLAAIEVRGTLPAVPAGAASLSGGSIRIYVNGKLGRQAPVPATRTFTVPAVPLAHGRSDITASVVVAAGEGQLSRPITVTLDDTPPDISVTSPADGSVVSSAAVSVRGQTQPGSLVVVRNETTGVNANGAAAAGAFNVPLPIVDGTNSILVTATDRAGNQATRRLKIVRGATQLTASLALSQSRFKVAQLPAPITISVMVTDPTGLPVDGATATFSLSPPGAPTATYETQTKDGSATWSRVSIPAGSAVIGAGFATVRVVTTTGQTILSTAPFTVEP